MNHNLNLNDRPFKAIKDGTKKVEGRTPINSEENVYEKMVPGNTITFTNSVSNEQLLCEILFVNHYDDVRKMLETEGTKNVLSSGLDIEGGIKSYNSLDGYEEGIKKYGIYAIGVKVK
jgi:ASC-1-like (ASCH) protein